MTTAADLKALAKKRSFTERVALAEVVCAEESEKLFLKEGVRYKFLNFDAEVKLVIVQQQAPYETRLTHAMVVPLKERIASEVHKRWHVTIKVKNSIWQGKTKTAMSSR
mgnify:CR=1 FL=1|tara:strand:- start:211 stop:537 length:327 start_codon:yes stop_codon:yes gene_type:complete